MDKRVNNSNPSSLRTGNISGGTIPETGRSIMNDVVCIGPAAVDTVFLVKEFPTSDEISLALWSREFFGGSSANVAVGLSRLGLYSGLISKVGKDSYGVGLLNTLISEGVDIREVSFCGKTAQSVILVNERGEKEIVADTECALRTGQEIPAEYCTDSTALYLGECFLPAAEKAIELAVENRLNIILRLKNIHLSSGLNLERIIANADFVIMNEKTHAQMKETRENFVITRGEKGCYFPGDDILVQGISVPCLDTTGAGDAFCAGFMYQILKGESVLGALRFANAAGAASTTRYGAMDSMPSLNEVESLLE
ncbi:MAG: carbohydrate kinase family protein [Theionarchaea archaeon]|nr:carbohydrate kinase family protein [Theionarchaea archaeon]MBU6999453.1 carbohydrate kinase family protein [Theionarchaea archaeon]MBU7021312.1 carbohydrate kinase family protein [Theionarchaea archaeon]